MIVNHLFGIPNYFHSLLEKINNALCFLQVCFPCCLSGNNKERSQQSEYTWNYHLQNSQVSSSARNSPLASKILKSSKLRPSLAAAQALAVFFLLVRVTAARARQSGQRGHQGATWNQEDTTRRRPPPYHSDHTINAELPKLKKSRPGCSNNYLRRSRYIRLK